MNLICFESESKMTEHFVDTSPLLRQKKLSPTQKSLLVLILHEYCTNGNSLELGQEQRAEIAKKLNARLITVEQYIRTFVKYELFFKEGGSYLLNRSYFGIEDWQEKSIIRFEQHMSFDFKNLQLVTHDPQVSLS